jgi:hypothetical protein
MAPVANTTLKRGVSMRRNVMNDQNKNTGLDSKKQRYEPPKATQVRVKVAERLGTCTFTSPSLCEYTT